MKTYLANSTEWSPACEANSRSASQYMPDNASYLAPDKEVHSLVHLQPILVTDLFYTPVERMGEKRNEHGV